MTGLGQLLAATLGVAAGVLLAPLLARADEADAEAERIASQRAAMEGSKLEALELLKEMSDFLGKQGSFRMKTVSSREAVQLQGLRLEFGATSEYLLRRPDRLRIDSLEREGAPRSLFYDGRSVSIAFERENAYVQVERSGDLEDMLDYVVDDLAVEVPLSDLLDQDFHGSVSDRVELAAIVGESTIDGATCTHAVYRLDSLDFQIWIQVGDAPLPCRVAVDYRDMQGRPQFRARFVEWELGAEAPDDRFDFRPDAGAERLLVRASEGETAQ